MGKDIHYCQSYSAKCLSSSQYNSVRKVNQRHRYLKGRNKPNYISRWYNCHVEHPKESNRTNYWVQQDWRI